MTTQEKQKELYIYAKSKTKNSGFGRMYLRDYADWLLGTSKQTIDDAYEKMLKKRNNEKIR